MKYWSFVDEEKVLEELLNDPNGINYDTKNKIKLLIKHYKRLGYSKNEIRNVLDNYLMEHCKGFILADWDDLLRKYVNKYTKKEYCEFKKTEDVVIYKEELDFITKQWNIDGVNQIEVEKLLFVMLVLAKSNSVDGWLNYNDKIIFDMARYKFISHTPRREQKGKLFYKLGNHNEKVLECLIYSKEERIKLFYSKKEGEEVMRIKYDDDIENIIVRYLDWRKYPVYTYCERCGKEIKISGNRKKYCSEWAKKIKDSQDKQRYEKEKFRK